MNPSGRLTYEKPTGYETGVLVGNWFEERIGRYRKNRYDHVTVYRESFIPKRAVDKKLNDDTRNNNQIKSAYENNLSSTTTTEESTKYFDNFTSTYDLSFGYFPCWIPQTINRKMRFRLLKYEPTNEYLENYGNLSSRNNLADEKRQEWECDVLDPRRTVKSIFKSDYVPFKEAEYKGSRFPLIKPVQVQCETGKETVYPHLPRNHPRSVESNRNPIIWEGTGPGEM